MWVFNFSGSKKDLKAKHDAAAKGITTDQGDLKLIWPLVNGVISKASIRDAQTVDVAVSGGTVETTGRTALSINIVVT
jgi:hypothetical protein